MLQFEESVTHGGGLAAAGLQPITGTAPVGAVTAS